MTMKVVVVVYFKPVFTQHISCLQIFRTSFNIYCIWFLNGWSCVSPKSQTCTPAWLTLKLFLYRARSNTRKIKWYIHTWFTLTCSAWLWKKNISLVVFSNWPNLIAWLPSCHDIAQYFYCNCMFTSCDIKILQLKIL